jgi:hypothetical protein
VGFVEASSVVRGPSERDFLLRDALDRRPSSRDLLELDRPTERAFFARFPLPPRLLGLISLDVLSDAALETDEASELSPQPSLYLLMRRESAV